MNTYSDRVLYVEHSCVMRKPVRRRESLLFRCSNRSLDGRQLKLALVVMLHLSYITYTLAFLPQAARMMRVPESCHRTKVIIHYMPDIAIAAATETASSIDNLRQYVPLGVSVLVIIDILLGSPMANGLLNKIRPTANDTTNELLNFDDTNSRQSQNNKPSKERIDSQKVAQDAIQRARYTLELRSFLDAQRDPVVELQRKMDQQEALLEQNQKKLKVEMQRSKNDKPTI